MKRTWAAMLGLLPCLAMAGTLRPLAAADVPALVKPPAHGERIIALWALDCAYCQANLQALKRLQHTHPHEIELTTVATDSYAQHDVLQMHLRMAGVESYSSLAYAEASPERINFLIDPAWGGETPRVLVIHADGSRQGISGELTDAQLKKLR